MTRLALSCSKPFKTCCTEALGGNGTGDDTEKEKASLVCHDRFFELVCDVLCEAEVKYR